MPSENNNTTEFRWVNDRSQKGQFLFTFDGKTIFNLFRDYPYALTDEQKQIFDRENPYWAEFFKDRQKNGEA